MPAYALRYVFFGTRWGSNSSFAMVNLLFTSFCPARILLPCPDSDPVQCHLGYPKLYHSTEAAHNSSWQPAPFNKPDFDIQEPGDFTVLQSSLFSTYAEHCPVPPRNSSTTGSQPAFRRASSMQPSAETQCIKAAVTAAQSSGQLRQRTEHKKDDLQFPVLVPLWRIYVRERPLPIFLHTSFMTVAALLWPLQVSVP